MVGYQGVSSRPSSQRQSAITGSAVNTGRASAPARCATDVSQVTTRSSWHHHRRGIEEEIRVGVGIGIRAS